MNRERLVFLDPLAHRYDWILDSTVPADIIATAFPHGPSGFSKGWQAE